LWRSSALAASALIGIDTPELAHYGDPAECGAARATTALERFVGRKVRLPRDFTQDARDRYDRLLPYVDLVRSGKDIGRSQLGHGLAEVYVFRAGPAATGSGASLPSPTGRTPPTHNRTSAILTFAGSPLRDCSHNGAAGQRAPRKGLINAAPAVASRC
jgi:hypothetical protein